MSEKLCLKWNDFQENVNSAFASLRGDIDFSDVTLVCEDGQQLEVHKVILAKSSPFFDNVLRRNEHAQPIIYMRGVKHEDLLAIVDFLYKGEANILQENLESFLAIAEELKLKGLTGQKVGDEESIDEIQTRQNPQQVNPKQEFKRDQFKSNYTTPDNFISKGSPLDNERRMAVSNPTSGDLQELDEKVKSMMEKSQNLTQCTSRGTRKADICKVCGKEGEGINIRDHIESNHLEGISLPCNTCGNTFRSRQSLRKHFCH